MPALDIITVPEAQEAIGTQGAANLPKLDAMISGLTAWVEKLCGPFVVREVTARLSGPYSGPLQIRGTGAVTGGGWSEITPVYEITEVIETSGTTPTTLTADDWELEGDGHYVNLFRRSGGYDSTWLAGARNITVTLLAGRYESTATVGYDVKERFRSLLAEKWQYESSLWQRNRGDFEPDEFGNPVGFDAEARIRQLFASELLPPGMA